MAVSDVTPARPKLTPSIRFDISGSCFTVNPNNAINNRPLSGDKSSS
jgi:hypothetical protein